MKDLRVIKIIEEIMFVGVLAEIESKTGFQRLAYVLVFISS